jgi:hypothetical protein
MAGWGEDLPNPTFGGYWIVRIYADDDTDSMLTALSCRWWGSRPRHAHQPIACRILAGQRANLTGQGLDALIQPVPLLRQSLDEVQQFSDYDLSPGDNVCRRPGPLAIA